MRFVVFVLLAAACSTATASPYFVGNPYSPVPPSCIMNTHGAPLANAVANGDSVPVWEGPVTLPRVDRPRVLWHFPDWFGGNQAWLTLYRVACAEPGQSALVARFTVPPGVAGETARYVLPGFYRDYNGFGGPEFTPRAELGDGTYLADAGRDGNPVFGDFISSYDGVGWFSWHYVLDVVQPWYWGWEGLEFFPDIDVEDYNGAFAIGLQTPYANNYMPVPPTTAVLERTARLPLNGRLSGIWVVEGTRDQGFVLWVSSRVPPAQAPAANPETSPLLLALSWYTFDADGHPLWLTGAAEFAQGASQVDIDIDHTRQGAFLGDVAAARSVAGSVRLTAVSCDNLQLEWDLSALGLGTGSARLQRYEALEVAGYNCRDYESRQRSLAARATP